MAGDLGTKGSEECSACPSLAKALYCEIKRKASRGRAGGRMMLTDCELGDGLNFEGMDGTLMRGGARPALIDDSRLPSVSPPWRPQGREPGGGRVAPSQRAAVAASGRESAMCGAVSEHYTGQ
jgi:hypothetical protein